LGDIFHAIGYLAKLATFAVLATAHTNGMLNYITEEYMTVAFFGISVFFVYKDADKSHNARHQFYFCVDKL
jgi:hypothetical protein